MEGVTIDRRGNINYQRTPVEDGKEFNRTKAESLGIPEFARVEIPLNGRQQLRTYAEELRTLADTLHKLSYDLETEEVYVVMRARAEIRHASNRLRSRRGPRPHI